MLRPGGLLLVTVPANPYRYDWTDRWAGHRRRYDAGDLAARLGAAGFDGVDVARLGLPADGPLPPPGLPPRPAAAAGGGRRARDRRAAAAPGVAPGAGGPGDRLGLPGPPPRLPRPAGRRAAPWTARLRAPGRPPRPRQRRAAPCGAGVAWPRACWCWASWPGRWSTAGRPSRPTTGTWSPGSSCSACWCCWPSTSTSALGYGAIIDRLHHPGPPALVTLSIWARSLLGRYVPGNVLMVLGRVVLSHERGVPRRATLAATVYEQALSLGVAAAAGVIWLAAYAGERRRAPLAAGAGAARAGAAAPAPLRARLGLGAAQGRARAAAAPAGHPAAARAARAGTRASPPSAASASGCWCARRPGPRRAARRSWASPSCSRSPSR